ncbi:hypothetical protein BG262_09765 [Floricoccus penangensis]|uniref:Competence protein ComGG n=1 Tax=Floricoccus penangensis TaxID=1859475 RepID=A0A9Q5JH17_9LACT|nr:competence type IV pilus minor pilin ComGG [Floricoccus penangensis]OFI47426.1 hypothetical protein BG262_09765 [Floricoccus penangensis]
MKVRAGILIHVLFLAIIFTFILEFYITATIDDRKNIESQINQIKAEMIIDLAKNKIKTNREEKGQLEFDNGICYFETEDEHYNFKIQFTKEKEQPYFFKVAK